MSEQRNIREQVIEAARDVFREVGYDNADMRTIARMAGIAVGTIYNYFDGKDILFSDILAREKESLAESLSDMINNPNLLAEERIQSLCERTFGLIEKYGAIWREVAGTSLVGTIKILIQQLNEDNKIINISADKIITLFFSATEALAHETNERDQNSRLISQLFWSGLKK